jgi:hypothetical protein
VVAGTYKNPTVVLWVTSWQHILEHGKPDERSDILTKMAGQIVKMSQHKFASNVVEKCLEFGGPEERQVLITEMLGLTDENEPLQVWVVGLLFVVKIFISRNYIRSLSHVQSVSQDFTRIFHRNSDGHCMHALRLHEVLHIYSFLDECICRL